MQEAPIQSLSYEQLIMIMDSMNDEDKKWLNEIRTIRLPETLYLYVLQQANLDGKTFDEWVRNACISYAFHRMAQRKHDK